MGVNSLGLLHSGVTAAALGLAMGAFAAPASAAGEFSYSLGGAMAAPQDRSEGPAFVDSRHEHALGLAVPFGETTADPLSPFASGGAPALYTPRFGGFRLGASLEPDDGHDISDLMSGESDNSETIAIEADYFSELGPIAFGVTGGVGRWGESSGQAPGQSWKLGASLGYEGFSLGGSFGISDDRLREGGERNWDLSASYTLGRLGISLVWQHAFSLGEDGERDAERDAYRASTSYLLGPGIQVVGTLGYADLDSYDEAGTDGSAIFFVLGPRLSF